MVTTTESVQTMEVARDMKIAAGADIVFECLLEQMGPLNETPDHTPMPMKIEAWPGGRWYRDLGKNQGHLWGFVQSIRANDLLEICGPMFMSAPVMSHIIYRLKEAAGVTHISLEHRTVGQIPQHFQDGARVDAGWGHIFERVRVAAEGRKK